jgi:hypothetical protein
MAPRRVTGDDDEAWADLHAGDCLSGAIHELREAVPRGKPFERVDHGIGFLIYVGDKLVSRRTARAGKRARKKG